MECVCASLWGRLSRFGSNGVKFLTMAIDPTADGNISDPVRAYEYLSSLAIMTADGGIIR